MTAPSATVTALEPDALRDWVSQHEDLVVLDVRSEAEFESLHIRGSYNVPLSLLGEPAEQLTERVGSRVVLACQFGARAEQARQKLTAAGLDGAYVLTGGVPGYAAAGGDVVRGRNRWAMERQVRFAAGSLVVLGLLGGRFLSPHVRSLAGVIGAGLTFSAVTDTCAMGRALSALPWNKAGNEITPTAAITQLPQPTDKAA